MQIGILQTGHAPDELQPEHGDYNDMFERLLDGHGFTFRTWRVVDGDLPEAVTQADGWLITGSRFGAYEDHPWIPPLEAFIRAVHADGRPMVGICFGHQIIAKALGGKVEKFEGGWSVGRQTYTIEGQDMALNAWHQDQVTEPPAGATTVGSSDFCRHAALAYGDSIFTVQPHPEFDSAMIEGLIEARGRAVPPERVDAAMQSLSMPNSSGEMAARLASVLLKASR
ncbi:type 1 glutamine amidotransferase [Tropicimonas isoalkanivorans]|uniref:GMP synthase (Glutamine-hydrolysing) n=1 Tax=Tropicimonas isoalkanivorans TaxID=441112 RepID=A0A1I1JRD6_9RHOB|nr:type 1 glutamine amidotransferase [Tropicimonas isoalkanivorans]SFC49078.1 GMP synthase (glutamine-hydrolysing) [Tropicimonas isoalkanivorans]